MRKRRDDAEAEREEMERLKAEESRLREQQQYGDWQKKEEHFHLKQATQRSKVWRHNTAACCCTRLDLVQERQIAVYNHFSVYVVYCCARREVSRTLRWCTPHLQSNY